MSRKNANASIARFFPFFRERWPSDISDAFYEICFLLALAINSIKNKTPHRPNKIHLASQMPLEVTSSLPVL